MVKHRWFKIHIPIFVFFALFFGILYSLNITCPILFLSGIPCPTCGCTRALMCLLRGDLRGYVYYHPLAVFLLLAVVLMIHQKFFPKKPLYIFVFSLLAINFVFYVYRLIIY